MRAINVLLRKPAVLGALVTSGALILGIGIVQLLGSPRVVENPPPFQVPAQYMRITEMGPLSVSFPVPMRAESVEQWFTVEPQVIGSVEWIDERTMAFRPSAPLAMSGTYTVTVGAKAERHDGNLIGAEITRTFFVAGPLHVSQVIPPPSADRVQPSQHVTIIFDRPMVPLTTLSEAGNLFANWPVTVTPSTAGAWRWLSTTTAEFTPKNGLAPATEYRVEVPAGIPSIHGSETVEPFTWSFTTRRPAVRAFEPPDSFTTAGPKTQVVLQFNQSVDLESVKAHAVLLRSITGNPLSDEQLGAARGATLPGDIAEPVAYRAAYGKREENGKKVTDEGIVVLTPEQSLSFEHWYAVIVNSGVMSPGGALGSASPFEAQFKTAGPMVVHGVRQEYGGITIDFSNPYDATNAKRAISITPKPEGWDEITVEENLWDSTGLTLYPQLAPSTDYTIRVSGNLQDTFGQSVQNAGEAFTVRTPPIPPRVLINANGTFGIFERDFPPVQIINAVNVSMVHVSFAQLSLPEFLAEQRAENLDWDHVPQMTGRTMHKSWSFPTDTPENNWKVIPLDLQKEIGHPLPSGIYALTVTAPEYKNAYDQRQITEKIYFTLSRIALTFKYSGSEALVWAVDMKTGNPVAGAKIILHDLDGAEIVTGRTDDEGFFQTAMDAAAFATSGDTWDPAIWVTAETDDDFAFVGSSFRDGMTAWDFGGLSENWQPEGGKSEVLSYLYTDRPIYRAGDTVHFKGILRLKDARGILHPPKEGRRVRMRIDDAEGNTVFSDVFPLSAFGNVNGSMPLDPRANLGTYWMNAEFEDTGDIAYGWTTGSFEVLAYRKPEFRVDVAFDRESVFDGDTVRTDVTGAYYFGMPMENAKVSWRAMTTDYFFNRFTDGWYSFSLEDSWCWYECDRESEPISSGEGELGADGKFHVEIPVDLQEEPLSQVLSLDVDITDASNQVVSTRASIPVHKSAVYVGIKTEDYAVMPGEEAGIAIVTVDPEGNPLPNRSVEVTLFRRSWNTTRRKAVDGEYYYDNEPTDDKIGISSVTTDSKGKASAKVIIPSGGQFRVLLVAKDGAGREAKADTSVYAWSDTYINWPHSNSNRMTVTADAPKYRVGDTAKLIAQSPYQGEGVTALVTVEREGIMTRTVIPIESSAQMIAIPVTADMIPNAYVSVVVVKPRMGETFDESGKDTGAPAFRIGYAQLKVENASKGLTVTVEPGKRRYLPGETVEVSLLAQDGRGNPVQADISLAAVDMSVLALTGYRVPDLLDIFYFDRGLGVRTAENLLYILERFKPGSKGGGGADLADRARGNFKDTAYWNPSIITDAQGRAQVAFTLPDNLTTWKLIAIGSTLESQVGAFATEILETKEVIVRPVRPRYAVHGDRADLAAIVHNGTEEDAEFHVTLTGKAFSVNDADATIRVPAGGQGKVVFPVMFDDVSRTADFVFIAEGEHARDDVRESIPLVPFGVPHAMATSGFTDAASAEEHLFVPVRDEVTGVEAEVTLSPTLATYLPKGLEFLVQFPYGCAEQTVSSFLPNIAVKALQGFDAFRIVSEESLKEKVTAGIQRLLTFQRSDGGFGYWEDSRESRPYLSAYILHALHLAARAGYASDDGVMQRTRGFLREVLRNHRPGDSVDLSERAYILYVFGETGTPDPALLSNLYGERHELGIFAKAYLAMALERGGDHRRALDLLGDILASAKVNPRGMHFEEERGWQYRSLMNTNQRTTAIALQAMLRIDPVNPRISDVVRGMLAMRQGGHWDTTQSTTASIFSLVEFLAMTRELEGNFAAEFSVNGENVLEATFDAANILAREKAAIPAQAMDPGTMNALRFAKEGVGRLYYDILLTYFWKTQRIEPEEAGISIMREIAPVQGSPKNPTVGSVYKVKLTITVPEDRHFVAVESPHPAGMEGVDFALQTSQQHLQEELEQGADGNGWDWWNPSWYFTHREFRDDQVFLFADSLPTGVYEYEYLVRATIPGTFHWRPARAYEMYFPEVFGNTAGGSQEIRDLR